MVDYPAVKEKINEQTKVIGIQRSKGYEDRPSFTVNQIKEMIDYVKNINPNLIVFVDNCYGEFVEGIEPPHVGADIIAGSLDRKSTRLNSSHVSISYAVFCLKKKHK